MKLSIVTTLYVSAPYIDDFYRRICAAAREVTDDFEVIFVNDGSPDDSLDRVCRLFDKDSRVRVIDLSRNFGQHRAMLTGLAHARGERIFQIDCDLEEAPELLRDFWTEMDTSGADVVYGVQKSRKGGLFERVSGSFYYALFNFVSNTPIPKNVSTIRIMTQRYVQALLKHRETELFIIGLWEITGFRQVPLKITKLSKGSSTYTMARKFALFVNSITSFSNKPLVFIFYLGLFILFISTLATGYLVFRTLVYNDYMMGWPSIMVAIGVGSGLIIFCLGVIGIYLSKVFLEVKNRPLTIIRSIYQRDDHHS